MIPEQWEKVLLLRINCRRRRKNIFFYNTPKKPNEYQYIHEIPFRISIDAATFIVMKRYLFNLSDKMRDIFKENGQELWFSFTMSLERSGKFKVHYDYTDQMDICEYNYLGIEPSDSNEQKLIERYLEEYPNHPI